jgi:hypothetical protein
MECFVPHWARSGKRLWGFEPKPRSQRCSWVGMGLPRLREGLCKTPIPNHRHLISQYFEWPTVAEAYGPLSSLDSSEDTRSDRFKERTNAFQDSAPSEAEPRVSSPTTEKTMKVFENSISHAIKSLLLVQPRQKGQFNEFNSIFAQLVFALHLRST